MPQEPRQATAATQPYPIGDAIVPQSIDIPPEGASVLPSGAALINDGKIFTPFWTEPIAVKPGTMGGANWPPSSYDPETHLLYVCATRSHQLVRRAGRAARAPAANQVYMGGRFTQADADDRGILAALDVTTNKLAWRQQWREICYSGSIVTAGGLAVRRPQRRAAHGARQSERQAALGVHDRRRRQHDGDDVRVERRSARRRARGRRRVRGRDARRRHLDVLADGHDEVVARAPAAPAAAAAAPGGSGRPPAAGRESARRRRARPAALRRGLRRVPRRSAATAATAAARRSSRACRSRRSLRCRKRGRNTMPAFGRVYSEADLRDVASYVVDVSGANS